MHPIERLRHVARAGDADASMLAEEAALALGALGFEPRALVPATRRLLEFHPSCAPLWWVCAELLAAEDPEERAYSLAEQLSEDSTADQLAAALPGAATLATSGGSLVLEALRERPDLTIHLVASAAELRYQLRHLDEAVDSTGYLEDEADEALETATVVLLEADAAGPSGVMLSRSAAVLGAAAAKTAAELWVVAGCGRLLPEALFSALRARVGSERFPSGKRRTRGVELAPHTRREQETWEDPELDEDPHFDGYFLELAKVAVIVGPDGPARPEVALSQLRCPVPPELLVLSSGR